MFNNFPYKAQIIKYKPLAAAPGGAGWNLSCETLKKHPSIPFESPRSDPVCEFKQHLRQTYMTLCNTYDRAHIDVISDAHDYELGSFEDLVIFLFKEKMGSFEPVLWIPPPKDKMSKCLF